jgi:hypothetical protein
MKNANITYVQIMTALQNIEQPIVAPRGEGFWAVDRVRP